MMKIATEFPPKIFRYTSISQTLKELQLPSFAIFIVENNSEKVSLKYEPAGTLFGTKFLANAGST